MVQKIANYLLNAKIYESANSEVYRGVRESDRRSFILKVLKQDFPSPQELIRYKQEYEITRNLNLDGVVKAYGLEPYQRTLVIILEDFGASSLSQLMQNSLLFSPTERGQKKIHRFLGLAIQIAETLGQIHAANIIHKDLNPSNIVLNPDTDAVKIIDFGISTILTRENPSLKHPNVLEGTLAYLSPEQTGRMNRALDYRTDFYSLGVTFYELLTGQRPFATADAMELVHCQIAKQPVPPGELLERHGQASLPIVISNIVMKLMAKTAEERYQSAWGLKADLEECLRQLETTGTMADFPLGSQDISDRFQIPQKLYGREKEIATLLAAFERVATGRKDAAVGENPGEKNSQTDRANAATEMMLVAGYSGIGKSALVQEIYKPITAKRGYFISGKFDQFQRNVPYSALVNAFQGLVRQLLTEGATQLSQWQEKLLTALRPNAQVVIDVIPEVELILGRQPAVAALGPTESQNRFNLVFSSFIRVFCTQEHPLVIFLDDLQWVDSATLKLMELMMTDDETQYLFLIGAYRDNEVNSTHPLMISLENLQKENTIINQITLPPLGLHHVNQLIAETLHCTNLLGQSLAKLVAAKTQGNPFFVNQFLTTLHAEQLLAFDLEFLSWQWDIAQIKAMDITDNVVELMISKVKKLPEQTQKTLCLAACVGASFDLQTLSIVCEKSASDVFQALLPAVQSGLIVPTSELDPELLIQDYKFNHDRIQQAAYALIDDGKKQGVHLQIGRLLKSNFSESEQLERIFEVVDHLNLGWKLITHDREKVELAALNLEAGKKAKESAAYVAALQYLIAGISCLNENAWEEHYQLSIDLYRQRAEVEYLNGNFDRSESLIHLLLEKTKSAVEKAEIYNLLILQYTLLTKYPEAIEAGRKGLQLLDIVLPRNDFQTAFKIEFDKAKTILRDREISLLLYQPEIKDLEKIITIKLLAMLLPPTYLSDQNLFFLVTAKSANLSFEYGSIADSAMVYVCYASVLLSYSEDYQAAYEFALMSLKLTERFHDIANKAKVYLMSANFVAHWIKPVQSLVCINNEGYQAALISGNIIYAGYMLHCMAIHSFYQGCTLEETVAKQESYLLLVQKTNNVLTTNTLLGYQLVTFNLSGRTRNKFSFYNNQVTEAEYLKNIQSEKDYFSGSFYYILKSQISYLYDRPRLALRFAALAGTIIDFTRCFITTAEHNFYYSLSLVALYSNANVEKQEVYWAQLEKNQKQMRIWADNCPENFLHKCLLVEAEIARITGKDLEAMELYDRAITSAAEHEFIQNEALGNELAAKFWLGKGKADFAALYMEKARYGYQLWGAKRKVEDLEEKYPQWFSAQATQRGIKTKTSSTTTSGRAIESLDLTSVLKASQTLSGEIVLKSLLTKLMNIAIENAGAQRGFLLLEKEGSWSIEAAGTIDSEQVQVLQSMPIQSHQSQDRDRPALLSNAIVNYVARVQADVVLDDAIHAGQFTQDPYILANQVKSVLCTPLLNQNQLSGILYLENNLTTAAFTTDRIEVLKLLSSQAAISLQNAQLYVALRESERNLAQFLEGIPVGVVVLHEDGELYYMNQRAQELLGRGIVPDTTSAQLSEAYQLYVAGTDRMYPAENLPGIRALRGETVATDDLEIHQGDKVIPLDVWATPIFDEQGQVVYAIAAFQDTTQRKQAEAERLQFSRELAAKNIALEQAKNELAEYSRTLEQKVAERTKELSQTLEVLQATQAELVFENALLRDDDRSQTYDYQVGGSLPLDAPTYVVRSADRYLYKALRQGKLCYILSARQMGKSSLMVRMMHHLQQEGHRCAVLDMTRIGSDDVTPEQWYKGLAVELWQLLDLADSIRLGPWWKERQDLPTVQRLGQFFEEIMKRVGAELEQQDRQLVIFLDEIDNVLSLNFPMEDFFALIRALYNQRTVNPIYKHLTFAFFGVATPGELIADRKRTPFNIGQAIELNGFQLHEAQPLLQGLSEKVENPQTVLNEVLAWTGGQPFLTQKVCRMIRDSAAEIPINTEAVWVENLVRTRMIEHWESQDEPQHLRTIRDRILGSHRSSQLLALYQQILAQGEIAATGSDTERELLLTGIVVKQVGQLQVYNHIYQTVFDTAWVEAHQGR